MLQGCTTGGVREAAARFTFANKTRRLDDTRKTRRHHRVTAERTARGIDSSVIAQLKRLTKYDFFGAVANTEFRHIQGSRIDPQALGRDARRR